MAGATYLEKIIYSLEVEQIDSDEDLSYAERFLRASGILNAGNLSLMQRSLEQGPMARSYRKTYMGNVELCLLVSTARIILSL